MFCWMELAKRQLMLDSHITSLLSFRQTILCILLGFVVRTSRSYFCSYWLLPWVDLELQRLAYVRSFHLIWRERGMQREKRYLFFKLKKKVWELPLSFMPHSDECNLSSWKKNSLSILKTPKNSVLLKFENMALATDLWKQEWLAISGLRKYCSSWPSVFRKPVLVPQFCLFLMSWDKVYLVKFIVLEFTNP